MNKVYLTKKDGVWRIIDKKKDVNNKHSSFKTKRDALIFLKENYKNSNTRAIVAGSNGKFQMHIILKEVTKLKFINNSQDSLKKEEKEDINAIFREDIAKVVREADEYVDETTEIERLEIERLEKERLIEERLEKERLKEERLKKRRLREKKLEKEKLEKERLDRLEADILAQRKEESKKQAKKKKKLDWIGILLLLFFIAGAIILATMLSVFL